LQRLNSNPSNSTGLPSLLPPFAGINPAICGGMDDTNKISSRKKMAKAKRKAKIKANVSIGALSKARSIYADRGDVNSCGDWSAKALKEHCHSEEGFDIGKFERVLTENDIEWDINRKTHGWIGTDGKSWRQLREKRDSF
jgi:hypothetical protein